MTDEVKDIIAPDVALPDVTIPVPPDDAPEVEIDLSAFGTTTCMKALDDTGKRVGGYVVVFNQKDKQGDTFMPDADYGLDWPFPRPMLYHHGLKGDISAVGKLLSLTPDAKGIWGEGELIDSHPMFNTFKADVPAGKLFWSSLTLPHLKLPPIPQHGPVTRWPIAEATLTYNPVETRGTNVSARSMKAAYKAIGSSLPDEFDETEARETAQKSRAATKVERAGKGADTFKAKTEDIQMTPEEIKAMMADVIAESKKPAPIDPLAAMKADMEKIVAEQQAQIKTLTDTLAAKAADAPKSPLPVPQPSTAPRISGMQERRFGSWKAEDLSFYDEFMRQLSRQPGEHGIVKLARQHVAERAHDTEHRFERQLAEKFHHQAAMKAYTDEQMDLLQTLMPFKSLDDVHGNNYRPFSGENYYKANEIENTGQSGFGSDVIPTLWQQEAWLRIRVANPFLPNVTVIPMLSNPYKLPIESTDPTFYYTPETTDAVSLVYNATNTIGISKPGTAAGTMTAKKLAGRLVYSTEEQEDALQYLIPRYRWQLLRAGWNAIDNSIVNGDTVTTASTNINLIDGTPGTAPTIPNYIAFDGILKQGLVTNTTQQVNFAGGPPTLALLRQMRKLLLAAYGEDAANLVYVVDIPTKYKLLSMPEFSSWSALGVQGSNMTGLLPGGSYGQVSNDPQGNGAMPIGYVDQIPVYVSAEMALANSSGKIPVAGGTLGRAVIYHRQRWYMGFRRQMDFEAAMLPLLSDVGIMQATVRCVVLPFDTSSSVTGFNILV